MKRILITIIVSAVLLSGCATAQYAWKGEPTPCSVDNEYFTAEISPEDCLSTGCAAFKLTVRNKTNESFEIKWQETFCVLNGQMSGGGFVSERSIRERSNPMVSDTILPNSEFSTNIWPRQLIDRLPGVNSLSHRPMPEGENGVVLTVLINGKKVSEKLVMTLKKTSSNGQ